MKQTRKERTLHDLLYQALETERSGLQVYKAALKCALNLELKVDWRKHLKRTENHEEVILIVLETLGLDPTVETYGRQVVRHIGDSLLKAIEMGLASGDPSAAQLVAAECVVEYETKDFLNWELMGQAATTLKGRTGKAFVNAYAEVGQQDIEHPYCTMGWTRELWLESLGIRPTPHSPWENGDGRTESAIADRRGGRYPQQQ